MRHKAQHTLTLLQEPLHKMDIASVSLPYIPILSLLPNIISACLHAIYQCLCTCAFAGARRDAAL